MTWVKLLRTVRCQADKSATGGQGDCPGGGVGRSHPCSQTVAVAADAAWVLELVARGQTLPEREIRIVGSGGHPGAKEEPDLTGHPLRGSAAHSGQAHALVAPGGHLLAFLAIGRRAGPI